MAREPRVAAALGSSPLLPPASLPTYMPEDDGLSSHMLHTHTSKPSRLPLSGCAWLIVCMKPFYVG